MLLLSTHLVTEAAEQNGHVQLQTGQKLFLDSRGSRPTEVVKDSTGLNNLAIVDLANNPGLKSGSSRSGLLQSIGQALSSAQIEAHAKIEPSTKPIGEVKPLNEIDISGLVKLSAEHNMLSKTEML
jgi:hypothetical protein